MNPMLRALCFVLCLLALFGCGGSGGSGSVSFKTIRIEPSTVRIKPNESIQLTAVVDGTPRAVTWSIPGLYTFEPGLFTEPGKFKAPARSANIGVRVALTDDPTKFADIGIVVDSGFTVNIPAPSSVFVPYSGSKTLTANVTGAASNAVTWSVDKGSISADGTYTAPSAPATGDPSTFDVVVTATSVADPGKSATFTLKVAPPIEIVAADTVRYTIPKARLKYVAKVAGVIATSGVNWSAASGTVASDGTWTPNATTLGNVAITATLTSDTTKTAATTASVRSNLNVAFNFQTAGRILLALRPDKAPNHCANLVALVNEGFYTGIKLHRREAGFVVQWGCPFTKTLPLTNPQIGTGGPGYTIDFEPNDLTHVKYALGMARSTGLNTAGSQIYITLDPAPSLDGNYVVFGSVSAGQSVVDAIQVGDTITSANVELIPTP